MKKTVLIFAMVAIFAFSVLGASAASYSPTEGEDGTYSYKIKFNVKALVDAGDNAELKAEYRPKESMYGLVAVVGTDKTELSATDNYVYIDQATVDADGNVEFGPFLPMGPSPDMYLEEGEPADSGVEYFEECSLFIGGEGLGSAVCIGVLKDASGVEISGTVTDTVTASTSSKVATITVYDSTGTQVGTPVTTDADGKYAAFVPAGEGYKIVYTKPGFLSFTYTGVNVTAALTGVDANIGGCAGDVDENDVVELDDLRAVLTDYNETENLENANADVDDNGVVELDDLRAVLANYNETLESKTQAYTAQ